MNSIPFTVHWHLHRVFEWFDREPTLRVAVITGAGPKSFCAGQDLIELGQRDPKELEERPYMAMHPPTGFAGISRRLGKKPVVAAVNGFALGGGFEIVLNWYVFPPFLLSILSGPPLVSNRLRVATCLAAILSNAAHPFPTTLASHSPLCLTLPYRKKVVTDTSAGTKSDMTVASPTATFGLPESQRGIYAGAGGLPRLVRNVGLPLASEISMAGRTLSAQEALGFQLINHISSSASSVVDEAVGLAGKVANISPDAIVITRAAIRETWETASVERAYQIIEERMKRGLMEGENAREGLAAFREKRRPVWKASKL
jgi:enoyl-CoA hydratase/carnithine racemase